MRKNTKRIFVMCITIFVVTLAGCGKSKNSGQQAYQGPVRTWNGNGTWGVNPGCNRPSINFQSQAQLCDYIRNSPDLNGCNQMAREQIYRAECGGGGTGLGPSTVIVHDPENDSRDRRREREERMRGDSRSSSTRVEHVNTSTEESVSLYRRINVCDVSVVRTADTNGVFGPNQRRVSIRESMTMNEMQRMRRRNDLSHIRGCDANALHPTGVNGAGIPTYDIELFLQNDAYISDVDILAACECLANSLCDVAKKTQRGRPEICKKDQNDRYTLDCVNYHLNEGMEFSSAPSTQCTRRTEVVNGVRETETDCRPVSAPAAPVQVPDTTSAISVLPPVPATEPAAPAPVSPDSSGAIAVLPPVSNPAITTVTEENQCYPLKPYVAEIPADTQPGVDLTRITNLETKLALLRAKYNQMIVARTELKFDSEPSQQMKDALVRALSVEPLCAPYPSSANPCPIKLVSQGVGRQLQLNGSKATITTIDNYPNFNLSYANLDAQQKVIYVGENEIQLVITFRVYLDRSLNELVPYDQHTEPNIERNRVTLTERVVFTDDPSNVKVTTGPELAKLLRDTRSTDLDPAAACNFRPAQGK